ncbi:MAG: dipeptidase [Alphaproteobacteria bacterium]
MFRPLVFLLAAVILDPAWADDQKQPSKTDIAQIHDGVITIDTHVDIPRSFATQEFDPADTDASGSQVDLTRMEAGGLDAAFFIVYTPQDRLTPARYAKAMELAFLKFSAIHRMTDELYPDRVGLARTAADVRRLHGEGKRIALIGVENGFPMGEDVGMLRTFHALGARYFGLVHNGHNQLADSAQPNFALGNEATLYGGLSDLGRAAVRTCNALGIMVDISHAAKSSTLETIALSKAPVIASHSGVKGVRNHPRNLSDEELLALKANGGVVQIVALDFFIKKPTDEKQAAITGLRKDLGLETSADFSTATPETLATFRTRLAEIDAKYPGGDVSDLVDHIDYAAKLIGVDHVGIASDFQGGGGITGWNDASETQAVTAELLKRGFSAEDVAKIWGGNLLRVMEAVEAAAVGE